jgi:RNA polymerase sigma factor (sigma-70 family)
VSKEVEQKWSALEHCEQELHEEFGEEMLGCDSNDRRLVRLKNLQRDLGTEEIESKSTVEKMLEARDGYTALRDEKYFANERLIWTSAGNLNRKMKLPDLRQEASRGLLYAIERFRDRGTKFSTYAIRAIQTFSGRGSFNGEASAVEIPIRLLSVFRHMKNSAHVNRHIEPEEVMSKADVSRELAVALLIARRPVEELSQSIIDDKTAAPEDMAHREEIWSFFDKALGSLTDRECKVFLQRSGLYEDIVTLEDIGKSMNPPVTRERIRQIEERAIKKIQAIMRKRFPMEVIDKE